MSGKGLYWMVMDGNEWYYMVVDVKDGNGW